MSRVALLIVLLAAACGTSLRPFVDRPVAWAEHDDEDMPRPPDSSGVSAARVAIGMLNLLVREVDRVLSVEWRRPADDVNALDEVPCSTWFCPRNHLGEGLAPAAIAAGPPDATRPVLPLRIISGNEDGAERGFDVIDGADRRFRLKFDPVGFPGLATSAEAVAHRLFWAAGYNTPGAFVMKVIPDDLQIAPGTITLRHGYEPRLFTLTLLAGILAKVAITPEGTIPAVAVAVPRGKAVGAFDFIGQRDDDPNDRIPHQHRRSLRASRVLAAWIDAATMSAGDTQDYWVEEGGRHFIRHYFMDFSSTFGAAWNNIKGPWQGEEQLFELSNSLQRLLTFGVYRRDWQEERRVWEASVRVSPAVGWFPSQGWSPEEFTTVFPLPAHSRMTDRDGYWGAKIVTSFTDDQIHAAVSAGGYRPDDAARLEDALRARRDAIGRYWLTRLSAIERPEISADGKTLCVYNAAIERRAARVGGVLYGLLAGGTQHWQPADGIRTCLAMPQIDGPYAVVTVLSRVEGVFVRAARLHLAWRADEGHFVVAGFERDE
jgi:hypothetical protein